MQKQVIIYGTTVLSQMVYYDSRDNTDFKIAAFTIDKEYLHQDDFCGLPQIDIIQAIEQYPPNQYDMLAIWGGYTCVRNRAIFYDKAKAMGYSLRNYVSPKADVAPDLIMGDNNIIMSQAHVGLNGKMGNNNHIRQNVYLGHDFLMHNHNVISPGCNIGGHCQIGSCCYICIGSTIIDRINIADETLVGAGGVVIRNTEPYSKNVGCPARVIGYHKENGIQMSFQHGEGT